MKILIVNYRYYPAGGPEKYMFNISRLLEAHGHEVIPFSTHSSLNTATPYENFFVDSIGGGDAFHYEEYKKTPRVIKQLLERSIYSPEVKKAIQKEIRETKPDLVYVLHFVNKLSPSVIRGAKEMGVPVVSRLSDYFLLCPRFDFLCRGKVCEECLTKGYGSCIRKKCVKGSFFASSVRVLAMKIQSWMRIYDDVDAFVTPSRYLREKLIANGFDAEKIHCIPTFTSSSAKSEEPVLGQYGLYFGRIAEEKGVETAVKAYEALPDHRLVIMGDDTTEEAVRLKAYVKEHGLTNVEFIGYKSGAELEDVIRNARCTLIPSIWYDNLPNTALESFRFSKPVIASNIGSLPELVEDGVNGYLFTPGNSMELAEQIRLLDLDERVEQMGKASNERLASNFSPEVHYERLIGLFHKRTNDFQELSD